MADDRSSDHIAVCITYIHYFWEQTNLLLPISIEPTKSPFNSSSSHESSCRSNSAPCAWCTHINVYVRTAHHPWIAANLQDFLCASFRVTCNFGCSHVCIRYHNIIHVIFWNYNFIFWIWKTKYIVWLKKN